MPKSSFTAKFFIALACGILIAVVIAPLAAIAVGAAGFRFPFPRIFDRVVMVSLAIVLIASGRSLRVIPLLRAGYARPGANVPRALRGLAVALGVMALLFAGGAAVNGLGNVAHAARMLPKYALSAIVIAIIEEGFFRAFLFAGMENDFGQTGALIVSSAIYAIAHLVRAPARFYVTGLDFTAGVHTLALSFTQLADPTSALPTLVGLFLLGIVLAEAFVITRTVWFSVGLHAGFVIGAKLWPKLMVAHAALPGWLVGWGHQPLISGAAAWVAALATLALLRPLSGTSRRRPV
jgi:membrane protease YdiL (CAAX protease family)